MKNVKKWDERGVRSLDLHGMEEREQRREEVRKQEAQQTAQQVDAVEAVRRGFRSFLEEGHRKIDLQKLKDRDPAKFAFLVRNTSIETA